MTVVYPLLFLLGLLLMVLGFVGLALGPLERGWPRRILPVSLSLLGLWVAAILVSLPWSSV